MRISMLALSLILAAGSTTFAQAKTLDFKPMMIEVKPQGRYLIRGFKGKITFIGKPNSKALKVTLRQIQPSQVSSDMKDIMDEWMFSVQRRENVLEAVVKPPHGKSSLAKTLQTQQMPSFEMLLEGPPQPLEMALREGSVRIEGWTSSLKLFGQKANVTLKKTEGDFQIAVHEGSVAVVDHKGKMAIESYSSKISVKESEGPLSIMNFAGSTSIDSHGGPLELNGYQGAFAVNKGRGRIDFDVDRASLKIAARDGDLRGKSMQGPVTASLTGEAEVRITTTEGNVSLSLNSGAQVNVGTDDGQIYAPNYLRVSRGSTKTVHGRLSGKGSGNVYVRSQSGSIRLR